MPINQDISNLPTPPNRSDSPSDFSDKADAFLASLPTLQLELNLYADEANTTQTEINTSESNAATSESNAASSASAALTSENNAATSESNASDSASAAATSESNAASSASAAATSESNAATSETNAANSESAAATSETNASNSASAAATSETNAADSASAASTSESNAATSEANAEQSAIEAENSASAAAATTGASGWDAGVTYDTNDAAIGSDGNSYRSLTDNNTGNDPVAGDGSNWINLTATLSDQEVRDLFSASGDLTYNSSTGVFSVTTSTVPDILKPDILSPFDGETDIGETPIIKTGGYYSLFGIEQASAQFQVATDSAFTNIVYDSGVLGPVTEHQVPAGNLLENTTHYVRAEFKDSSNNSSGFSDPSEFTTQPSFADLTDPNNIGIAVEGGFLAGNVVSDVDGVTYAIIVSDGDGDTDRTGAGSKAWRTSNTALTEAQTLADGKSVMDHIVANETLSNFPAFEWIQTTLNNANYNGYSDWYLPARDELELIYRHFKPTTEDNNDGTRDSSGFGGDGATNGTNNSSDPNGSGYTTSDPSQTSITSFQDGGADYLTDSFYWSSTEYDASNSWRQYFYSGRQTRTNSASTYRVRAVRRVQV